ncbi:MAG: carbohydrate kinase family protein, partial [Candidatus Taylorbacteria bacterium]|nr:carbohydrate kinase family protein [Candidatus Taylorbacteria bacterium]
MEKTQLDFLAVGDITTDAFIKLSDAWIETDNPEHTSELCMKFAEKIPYKSVTVVRAVGNAPNAAVSAARLGLHSGLITDIGNDENGAECKAVLEHEQVNTAYVTTHKDMRTNYHYVLSFGAERTILVKHEEYDYRFPNVEPAPKWLYLSSLGENAESYHYELADYLHQHRETKLAFQPGTFQMKLGAEKLAKLYERCELFFCNREEAERILKTHETDIKQLLKEMSAFGPKITVITDGPMGAYAYDGHSNEYWSMPMYPDPKPPENRTGAGDAFSSTFTVAIALGLSVREALMWGPINSAYVVQHTGAQ